MGRPGAAKRLKKAEKAKVQLKGYSTKFLPKGKNVTDTTFKVRKIVLQDQIKTPDQSQALTRRKLSIKEVLARLQHYSSAQRLEGLSGISELLRQMDRKQLTSNLLSVLDNLGKLSLDVESRVRRSAAGVLTKLLALVDESELSPFSSVLGSYVSCAMTHIKPGIQEDSLLILDALLQYAPSLIAASASQLLSCSLDMISRLKDSKGVNRQLNVNLSSSLTSSAWRASVLGRLQALLQVSMAQLSKKISKEEGIQTLLLSADALKGTHLPLYNPHFSTSSCLGRVFHLNSSKSYHQPLQDSVQLKSYTESLIPLLLDSWIEVSPSSKPGKQVHAESEISSEAAIILHCVLEILYLLWQHLTISDKKNGSFDLTDWFKQTYNNNLHQYFTIGFPFVAKTSLESDSEEENHSMKHRKVGGKHDTSDALALFHIATPHLSHLKRDSSACDAVVQCMPQNLRLCYIFASVFKSPPKCLKEKILTFLTSCLNDWDASYAPLNDHLFLALKTTIDCSLVWSCDMNPLVSAVVERFNRSVSKRSQTHRSFAESLCSLLGSIVLTMDFPQLQKSEKLCSWLFELPASLNNLSLSLETLCLLSKLASQRNEKFLQGLQHAVPSLLNLLQSLQLKHPEVSSEISLGLTSLLFWVPHWTPEHITALGDFLSKSDVSCPLAKKLINIVNLRLDSCPELGDSSWWDEVQAKYL